MYAVIRIRGRTGIKYNIKDTLDMLNLTRISHCVIIPENPSYKGMLQKAKDYITWGEVSEETLKQLVEIRGRLPGNKRISEEFIKENTDFASIDEFVQALLNNETTLRDSDMKPIFRLNPPRKGYESTRKPYPDGGSLGYRSDKINDLIMKMI